MGEIRTKVTIKTPGRRHRGLSKIFIPNFEQISRIVLVFSLLNLNLYMSAGKLFSFLSECSEAAVLRFSLK